MSESQLSNSRKHQRSEQNPLQLMRASQTLSKRRKSRSQTPSAFWDNLSKLWLNKRALRELDRRNAQSASTPPRLTRHALTKLRKNRQPTQFAPDLLYDWSPRCLKDIKLFARHGGPNLTDLRGFPEPANTLNHRMPARIQKRGSNSISLTRTTNTTTTGAYDFAFEQNLIDGGIYPEWPLCFVRHSTPVKPSNVDEIKKRLAQPRPSLSPSKFSEEAHEKFRCAHYNFRKDKQVMNSVLSIIEGDFKDCTCVAGGIPFKNLDHLTDGTIQPGNPDLYDGARPEQLDQQVCTELSGQIIPSEDDLLIAPNFFLYIKGGDGIPLVAHRATCYDGALGARCMHSLQSWGRDKTIYDNCAYAVTSTYESGRLTMYTCHPVQPTEPGKKPEIYMNLIGGWVLIAQIEQFRQGATAFRNARDWAREQRDEAIRQANARAKDRRATDTT